MVRIVIQTTTLLNKIVFWNNLATSFILLSYVGETEEVYVNTAYILLEI